MDEKPPPPSIEEYAAKVVETFPPLSDEQAYAAARIFASTRTEQPEDQAGAA